VVKTRHTFSVSEADTGARLDKLLVLRGIVRGRRWATQLFSAGAVRVNGRRVAKAYSVGTGDDVVVEIDAGDEHARPEPGAALSVVLERPELVVVDKPAGQPTAPLSGAEFGTLANALVGRYAEMQAVGYGPLEPGLLHRLDTQTSGVVLAARHPEAFELLRAALIQGSIVKRYLALVSGTGLDSDGSVTRPLRPHVTDRRRVVVCQKAEAAAAARNASTRWRVIERYADFTLVELVASRAYRHQIRVHLASLGYPLVGDPLYGGPPDPRLGHRHALHASHIAWAGSAELGGFEAEAPLPADLAALCGSTHPG
jgi:23S rRNA pseudouridine1911/1915/1917 synthase